MVLVVGFGAFAAVGALVVAKRPNNPIGWILAAVALMVAVFPAGDSYAAYVMSTRGRPDVLAVLGAWAQSWYWYLLISLVVIYLPMLFPDGRLLSRRWLWVAVPPGIATLATVVLGGLTDTLSGQNVDYRIENPIGIEGLAPVEELPVFGALGVLLGVGVLGAITSVAVRYRRSRGIERQQMKWFLYPAAFLLLFFVIDYLPGIVGGLVFAAIVVGQPVAIGIAVLRYRLYEIDIIINRTLVYGSLTVLLVAFYFGGRNHGTGPLPRPHGPGAATPTGCGCLHPRDSGVVQSFEATHPGLHRQALLPQEVRRDQDTRGLLCEAQG